MKIPIALISLLILLISPNLPASSQLKTNTSDNSIKVIHTLVALCDNKYQGIVPVPAKIGNGDDLINNLYWGAAYGVKNYFKNIVKWEMISDIKDPSDGVLERVVFKHRELNVYLVADAYRGREIKKCTVDLFDYAAGSRPSQLKVTAHDKERLLNIGGNADLIAYVGHNGLMDFSLDRFAKKAADKNPDVVVLACMSKPYFKSLLEMNGAKPILLTTGFMAPGAYVLEAAINSWIRPADQKLIRVKAAEAYNRYQKCGMKGALNLFSTNQ